jgi:Tfp pilus assembly protein PilN
MVKKDNNLTIDGASASINGVANFITALKRSGYFSNIEIKESKQDEKASAVQTYNFSISAQITPPGSPVPASTAKPASAPVAAPPASAARPKVG